MDYEQTIATAISTESVCGENLEDDSGFQNFFFEAEGTPERFDGQNTLAAQPPDWRDVKKHALSFLSKTKDIKLISILCQSVLNTEGIIKFESCLKGLASLITEHWDNTYPVLDEDDGDPMERVSALGHLNDSFVVDTLKNIPLASAKGVGDVTLQVIEKALADSEDSTLSLSQIKGVFSAADATEATALLNAITQCSVHFNQINHCFIEKAGNEYNVSFDSTLDVLKQLSLALEKHANVKLVAEETLDESASSGEQVDGSSTGERHANGASMNHQSFSAGGKLGSRKDVEACFALILDYYARAEPSSPVPILINRANKLIHLEFLEIIKDIYPDALSTLQQLGGIKEKDEESESSSTDDSW